MHLRGMIVCDIIRRDAKSGREVLKMALSRRQLYEVAWRRLDKGESNLDISNALNIDQAVASRALQQAYRERVLRLQPPRCHELAERVGEILSGLGQEHVFVVECLGENPAEIERLKADKDAYKDMARSAVAAEAALRTVSAARRAWNRRGKGAGKFLIGLSGGRTLVQLASALGPHALEKDGKTEVVALDAVGMEELVSFSAPFVAGFVHHQNPSVKATGFLGPEVVEQRDFDLVVLGISSADHRDPDTVFYKLLQRFEEQSKLSKEYGKALGLAKAEVLYNLIDSRGRALTDGPEPFHAASLAWLQGRVDAGKEVMLVVVGPGLGEAVLAAYRARCFSHLVCCDWAAHEILEVAKRADR